MATWPSHSTLGTGAGGGRWHVAGGVQAWPVPEPELPPGVLLPPGRRVAAADGRHLLVAHRGTAAGTKKLLSKKANTTSINSNRTGT